VFEIDVPMQAVFGTCYFHASAGISIGGLPHAAVKLAALVFNVDLVGKTVRGAVQRHTASDAKQARLLAPLGDARDAQGAHDVACFLVATAALGWRWAHAIASLGPALSALAR